MINLNEVVQYLKRNYPNLKAEIVTAAKNGGECTGISVTFRENASAIYYPNSYETDCDKVINEILTMIGKIRGACPLDEIHLPTSFNEIKDKLTIGVMNESYEEMLKSHHIIIRREEDLILYPVVVLNDSMSFKVTKTILKLWNVTEEQVFEAAYASEELNNVGLHSSFDLAMRNLDENYFEKNIDGSSERMFLVLFSHGNFHTAGAIFSPVIQKKLNKLFPDGFLILPASVFELLILPPYFKDKVSAEICKAMVKDVNMTEVSPEEYLSDSVYTIENGKLKKVA